MKKLLLPFVSCLTCLAAPVAEAAIPVGAGGSPVQAFTTQPNRADWSHLRVAGGGGTPNSAATLEPLVQTNVASIITNTIPAATGNPPVAANDANWASQGGYLITRPTSVSYQLVMATLQNTSGSAQSTLYLNYDLTIVAPLADEVQHLVYYSLTGEANSWQPITDLYDIAGDNTAGVYAKSTVVNLIAPIASGATFYLLWADDNGSGGPDTAREIDNVRVAFNNIPNTPPCSPAAPANVTALQCRTATFTVVIPADCGFPTPTIQWYRNVGFGDEVIDGQTGTTLTLNNVQAANAGQYFVRLNNFVGSADSGRAQLTVTPDNAGPQVVSVVFEGGVDNTFVVTFDEPVDSFTASDTFNYIIRSSNGAEEFTASVITQDANNPAIVRFTAGQGLTLGLTYTYLIGNSNPLLDTCNNTVESVNLTGSVLLRTILHTADDLSLVWNYDDTGTDMGTTWKDVAFNDSGWKTGKGLFDGKDVTRNVVSGLNVGTQLQRRIAGTPFATVNVPTMYFRTRVNIAAGTAGISVRTVADDAYVLYVNGTFVNRLRVAEANDPFALYSAGGTVGDGNFEGPIEIPLSLLNIPGDNVFAVLLKQNDATSTDITWGMEVAALVTGITLNPVSIVTQPTAATVTEGRTLRLSVTASGTAPTYQWYRNGNPIPGANANVYTAIASSDAGGNYHVVVANTVNSVTSDTVAVTLRPVVVPIGATWKFSTASQDDTLAGATPWHAPAFDDSTWSSGAGLFGLEPGGNGAARLPIAIATPLPAPSATFLTAYFRAKVTVPQLLAGQSLVLVHFIDDGAAFYFDGALGLRYNLTAPLPIYSTNVSPGSVPGDGEAVLVSVPVTLSPGEHTIAVEVHQNAASSSDVVFGAELRVINTTAPALTITHPAPTSVQLSWAAHPLYSLYSSTIVDGQYIPVATTTPGIHSVPNATNAATFFRIGFNGQ